MGIADALQTYGPWAVVTVLLEIIRRLAGYVKKLHEQQRESDRSAMAAQREETKATVTAIVETRDALRAFREAMEVLARKLDE